MSKPRQEPATEEDECCPGREDVLVVSDLETLRLVSDPFRVVLLELLRDSPRTVKEMAAELDVPVTRLYYHMKLLDEHGLIRVASTRLVSGIVEKRYEVTASRLSVNRALLSPGEDTESGLETHLAFILDESKTEIRRAFRAGLVDPSSHSIAEGGLVLGRVWFRLTQDQADELDQRLSAILEEYASAPTESGDSEQIDYEFLIGLYPNASRNKGAISSSIEDE
jgi:DNA-binding transcriptional ArsR family regulator